MLCKLMFLMVVSCALAGPAMADSYWVSYEGNDFPENEGWERTFSDPNGVVGQGGAVRTIEDGVLTLDSRESVSIVDFYNWMRPVNPDPGETFRMRWRVLVDDVPSSYPWDPVAGVFSDNFTAVGFQIAEDRIRSTLEPGIETTLTPGVFHSFEFVSSDMDSYELYIDGVLGFTGSFVPVFEASRVGWGDGIEGASSLSKWDYFEFGVVPEPASAVMSLALIWLAGPRIRRQLLADENRR